MDAADGDDRGAGPLDNEGPDQLDAILLRHHHVGDYETDRALAETNVAPLIAAAETWAARLPRQIRSSASLHLPEDNVEECVNCLVQGVDVVPIFSNQQTSLNQRGNLAL